MLSKIVNISFPGLGIDGITVNKEALSIGSLSIRWYGIIITLGIILAMLYCVKRSKEEGIIFDDLLDMAIFTIIFAVIGARLYYVLTSLDKYDSIIDALKIWNGGIAIYGAIIGAVLVLIVYCKIKKKNIFQKRK